MRTSFLTQQVALVQVAVVREGEAAEIEIREDRLDVSVGGTAVVA